MIQQQLEDKLQLKEMLKRDLEYLKKVLKDGLDNLFENQMILINFTTNHKIPVDHMRDDIDKFSDDITVYYEFILQSDFNILAVPALQKLIDRFNQLELGNYKIDFVNLKFFLFSLRKYGEQVKYQGKDYVRIQNKINECLMMEQQEQQEQYKI